MDKIDTTLGELKVDILLVGVLSAAHLTKLVEGLGIAVCVDKYIPAGEAWALCRGEPVLHIIRLQVAP